jgi:hypothetical protein
VEAIDISCREEQAVSWEFANVTDFRRNPADVRSLATGRLAFLAFVLTWACTGCGTTKSQLATQQLLTSDAIDRTVAQIDFSVLSGQKVFFDSQYVDAFKPIGFITNKYIISALRQQMFGARCIVVETKEEADYIVEARVGALGIDEHDVTYGLPASTTLTTAASIVSSVPAIPTIPEISIARRQVQMGATKISVFAYHKESKTPVWQSGNSTASSYAKSFWIFGAGPFQRGSVYDGTRFAGSRLGKKPAKSLSHIGGSIVSFSEEHIFFENAPSGPAAEVAESTKTPTVEETTRQ